MALHHARATEAESIRDEERGRGQQQQQHQRANAHTKRRREEGFGVANADVNAPMLIKIVREETGGPVGR